VKGFSREGLVRKGDSSEGSERWSRILMGKKRCE
jgi:hypothetical protein